MSAPPQQPTFETTEIQGVQLFLSPPVDFKTEWIGQDALKRQLLAAWLKVDPEDLPLTPRLIGKPGIGKTTLAFSCAKLLNENCWIYQCTMDTRPEDLLITPVISAEGKIKYHASPLVTAMIYGGICILDEGNRMSEKSWASLAPLLDHRRYIESIIAGIIVYAHPDFRTCVTVNEDASTYEIPEYIDSRLQPIIEVGFPGPEDEYKIIKYNLPFAPDDLVKQIVTFLQAAHEEDRPYTVRDGVNIGRYALKLGAMHKRSHDEYINQAIRQIIDQDALDFKFQSEQEAGKFNG
ncbi:MAG: AAA family ATPase [Candidatus Heimdallarchaeota archaeon]